MNAEPQSRTLQPHQQAQHLQQFSVSGHVPEHVYLYDSADGAHVGAVARFAAGTLKDKKTFLQFRFEEGSWKTGLGGAALPLYRSAEVLNEIGARHTILVVEGEKCVEVVRELGFAATTNAGGAEKWRADHSEVLRGAHVVLIADNDAAGRAHVEKVATSLHGVAASVAVAALPGIEDHPSDDGWDVADWISEGGTREQLERLIHTARPWEADPWPTPTHFSPGTECVPIDLASTMPPTLAALAAEIAKCVKVDEAAVAALIPAVISAAAGNAYCVRVSPGYREPNLARYVIWAKPSGERGSETFRRVTGPLDRWSEREMPAYREAKTNADADAAFHRKRADYLENQAAKSDDAREQESLRADSREARKQIPPPPRPPLAYIGDTTSEALVRSCHEQGGGFALFSADARHAADEILGRYGSEGRTNDSVYLRAHGGDTIDRNRVGADSRGEFFRIPHPSLSMALCVQPDKFTELAQRPELFASGLIGRLNIVHPPSLVGTRIETGDEPAMDVELVRRWEMCITGILDARFRLIGKDATQAWTRIELSLDDEARSLRRVFANDLERRQGEDGDLRAAITIAAKAAGEAARLAGLFHLVDLRLADQLDEAATIPIPASTWRYAEAHQRWQLAETLRVLSLSGVGATEKNAARLLDWVARKPAERGKVAPRDVVSSRIVKSVADANQVLALLVDLGWARPIQGENARTQLWEFHPDLCSGGES